MELKWHSQNKDANINRLSPIIKSYSHFFNDSNNTSYSNKSLVLEPNPRSPGTFSGNVSLASLKFFPSIFVFHVHNIFEDYRSVIWLFGFLVCSCLISA